MVAGGATGRRWPALPWSTTASRSSASPSRSGWCRSRAASLGTDRVPDGLGFQVGEHAVQAGGGRPVFPGAAGVRGADDPLEVVGGGRGQVAGEAGGGAAQVDGVD